MKHRILIVDDEASIRESLSGILEDEGFRAVTAASAEEGLVIMISGHATIETAVQAVHSGTSSSAATCTPNSTKTTATYPARPNRSAWSGAICTRN
jgi:DNA-binding NtrC family response regulator